MKTSPRIESFSWGRIKIEGYGVFKDAKLFPGGVREWDWSETKTAHDPGIQPQDVVELLEHGAQVVVLSRGVNERLRVSNETLDMLERKSIGVHVLQTEKAVLMYNELRETELVGGLFHSTC